MEKAHEQTRVRAYECTHKNEPWAQWPAIHLTIDLFFIFDTAH